ncbi:hypothetical protein BS17DRAFT_779558 [Gyrodon lividus]|nr:hypothetical protein BS17DRAFT_779558 [Gyrodon lividus]
MTSTTRRNPRNPFLWDIDTEKILWKRSHAGKPKRVRTDRPPLAHDAGWYWDGNRIFLYEGTDISDWEDSDGNSDAQEQTGERRGMAFHESLFDFAGCRMTKRCRKARTCLGDFEVVKIPKVIAISEGDVVEIGHDWDQDSDKWEKVDIAGLKRTYSEVLRNAINGKDPQTQTHWH